MKDLGNGRFGCNNEHATAGNRCSTGTTLTDDDFSVGGWDYAMNLIMDSRAGGRDRLWVSLTRVTNSALRSLKFCIGTTAYAWSSAGDISRSNTDVGWSAGDRVSLSIGTSCRSGTPPRSIPPATAPAGLNVAPGDAKLDLTWRAPAGTVTGYDVHYTASTAVSDGAAVGSDTATGWVAVSRTGTRAAQEIARLTNGQAYRVRVRAKNGSGAGPWAFATGTPQAEDRTGPAAPTFDPAHGTTTTNVGTNITLTFGEAIRKDNANTGFTGHADLASILTLKAGSSSGADIGYAASIDSAATVITIDPTSDLPGGAVYTAISNGYYDASGNRGTAASATFTVESTGRTPPIVVPPDLVPTFGAATVADRSYTAGTAIAALVLPEATGGDGTLRYRLTPAPPAGLTLDAATRTLSGTPDTPQGAVRYTWRATDADGDEATLSFTIAVTSGLPTALTLSAAPAPVEGGGEVTVTARLDAAAPVGGTTVRLSLSGTAAGTGEEADYTLSSATIAIAEGATEGTATIAVIDDAVADDGETIVIDAASDTPALRAETLTLTIADNDDGGTTPSSDASLSGLLISAGSLAFDPARTSYAVAVAHEVESVKLTPTVNHAAATVAVNGAAVASGTPSGSIALRVGENPVVVVVTAADGTTRSYRVTVRRAVKVLGAAEKEHVDKVGTALLGRDDPGVYPPEGASNR